jgi:hypothetical protein
LDFVEHLRWPVIQYRDVFHGVVLNAQADNGEVRQYIVPCWLDGGIAIEAEAATQFQLREKARLASVVNYNEYRRSYAGSFVVLASIICLTRTPQEPQLRG